MRVLVAQAGKATVRAPSNAPTTSRWRSKHVRFRGGEGDIGGRHRDVLTARVHSAWGTPSNAPEKKGGLTSTRVLRSSKGCTGAQRNVHSLGGAKTVRRPQLHADIKAPEPFAIDAIAYAVLGAVLARR